MPNIRCSSAGRFSSQMEPRPFEIVGKRSPAIVQPFDDLASANEAVERLVSVDISLTKIELLTKPDAIAFAANEENGFWQKLATLLFEDDDRTALLRDLRHGSHLLVLSDLEFGEDMNSV
ncbi:hypothetical protein [Rhizobium sp. BR 315]|uniref:hypothetical protein n=1 Tax=Rhizobium sp. BR 315 TaxID=3040014 RepID=UPI003D32E5C5